MTDTAAKREQRDVLVSEDDNGQLVFITLNRPDARNALSRSLVRELHDVANRLQMNTTARCVVISGAGERAFCAGADLKERLALNDAERAAHTRAIEKAVDAVAALPMPVVAAIRGYALGGGAELALACDLRVVGDDAVFGFPEVNIGIFPGAGGLERLPALVGPGVARDLLFTGRQVGAAEAETLGLTTRVESAANVMTTALDLARLIASRAPLAQRAMKQAMHDANGRPPSEARVRINAHRYALDRSADYTEGLAAFAERRQPVFRGE